MSKGQHVYFISDKRRRYVKIGVSNNPWSRILDLQAGSPLELRLDLTVTFGEDRSAAIVYEDALHQHFAELWRFREWFDYGPPIKEFVAAWLRGENPVIPQPPFRCKQYTDEYGASLSKDALLAFLRQGTRA